MKLARSGFTLLEILVTLAILGLVLTVVHSVLISTVSAVTWRDRTCTVADEAEAVLRQIARDLRGLSRNWPAKRAWPSRPHAPGPKPPVEDTGEETESLPPFWLGDGAGSSGAADVVRVLTTAPSLVASATLDTYRVVEYRLRHDSDGRALVRTEQPLLGGKHRDGSQESEPIELELSRNVLSFDVRCFDANEWLDEWDEESPDAMPLAVRIRLRFVVPKGHETKGEQTAELANTVIVPAWCEECIPKPPDGE